MNRPSQSPMNIIALLLVLLIIVAMPIYVLASDVTGSKYSATIVVSNNGSATTNTSTIFTANTTVYQDHGYLNATANNTAMRNSSGADLPFMVGYTPDGNPWVVWVPSISADGYATDILYFADSSGGELRYFPAAAGMVTADNGTLELSDNFSIEVQGFYDPTVAGNIFDKTGAINISSDGAGNIRAGVIVSDPITITPSGFANWVELDLSPYIAGGATGVVLEVNAAVKDCGFRKKGSTDARIQNMYHNWVMVGVDSDGICEAYIEDNTVGLYLVGYTDSSWTFKTNADDVSLPGAAAWVDIDVTALTSVDCVGVIIEVVNTGGAGETTGLRNDGSGDNRARQTEGVSHYWAVVGVDVATEIFEGWAGTAFVDFYLVGFVTAGSSFRVNAFDYSLGIINTWTDIDTSAQAPAATFLFWEINELAAQFHDYGFRQDGSTNSTLGTDDMRAAAAFTPCNSAQIVEGRTEVLSLDFWLQGYATDGIFPAGIGVTAPNVPGGEHVLEVSANGTTLEIMVDRGEAGEISDNTPFGAGVLDTSSNITSFVNYVMPYVQYQSITVNGTGRQYVSWEYDTVFHDQSVTGTNDAYPTFRTASSDPDISANLTSFTPISQAEAPAYALGPVNPFISGTGNVTGNFTTTVVPPPGGFPLAGVIAAVAGATATPAALPLLIIAAFVILAASLTTTYLLRKYGSGSLLVKAFVIIGVMGIFIALGDFGIDFWMLIVFTIMAVALAMASRQSNWE